MTRDHSRILSHAASYYASRLAQHGATPQGVDWNGTESHQRRHAQFLRLLAEHAEASIIDLGCGFGDFLRFLRVAGYRGRYVGYDVAPGMIAKARELFGEGGDRQWHVGAAPGETTDFAVASGIFNVKGDIPDSDWRTYVHDTIDVLARAGQRGFAFNVLSLSSDAERRKPHLHYADPAATLEHCLRHYGRSVALLQDYGLHEFTIIVRHASGA
jgi:SAM-dependent methyltransferase